MYRLYFLNGKYRGKRLVIQQPTLMIGRGPDCHLDLDDDDRVSHHHAVIEMREGRPVIRDLGALNKVEVNQRAVVEHRLQHGDRIEIGGTQIEFTSAEASAPPRMRRRFSKMQATSILAITLVVLLQIGFVVFFPIWQKTETVPAPMPPPEPKVKVAEIAPEPPKVEPAVVAPVVSPPAEKTPPPAAPDSGPVPVPAPEPKTPPPPAVVETPSAPAPAPALPAELVTAPPATPAFEDPLLAEAKEMIEDAKVQISLNNLVPADNILHRAQLLAPDYVPAWRERARLFEKRGMYKQAEAQWQRIAELTRGTPAHDTAVAEQKRLARLATLAVPGSETPVAEPQAPAEEAQLDRRIRIVSVDPERFREADEYDEMRTVRITLRPRTVEGPIRTDQLRVVVEFFDRVQGSRRIVPTRALVQDDGLEITGVWPAGEARTVTAAYVVPKGFRAREYAEIKERRSYEGYRVSIYYQDQLQDQDARPRRLLNP